MTRTRVITALAALAATLAVIATLGGILGQERGEPLPFTTARGESLELFGRGLYRYDALFSGANHRAQDIVVLVLGVPALAVAAFLARRGSRRGRLLLTLRQIARVDLDVLARRQLPYRAAGLLMLVGGAVTLVVWALPLVSAQLAGAPPDHLDHNTTMVTDALDLAFITPGAVVAGLLLLRRRPLGIAVAMPLLGIIVLLLPLIAGGTISQLAAGIRFTPAEIGGPIAGFGLLGVAATALLTVIIRRAGEAPGRVEEPSRGRA